MQIFYALNHFVDSPILNVGIHTDCIISLDKFAAFFQIKLIFSSFLDAKKQISSIKPPSALVAQNENQYWIYNNMDIVKKTKIISLPHHMGSTSKSSNSSTVILNNVQKQQLIQFQLLD